MAQTKGKEMARLRSPAASHTKKQMSVIVFIATVVTSLFIACSDEKQVEPPTESLREVSRIERPDTEQAQAQLNKYEQIDVNFGCDNNKGLWEWQVQNGVAQEFVEVIRDFVIEGCTQGSIDESRRIVSTGKSFPADTTLLFIPYNEFEVITENFVKYTVALFGCDPAESTVLGDMIFDQSEFPYKYETEIFWIISDQSMIGGRTGAVETAEYRYDSEKIKNQIDYTCSTLDVSSQKLLNSPGNIGRLFFPFE